MSISDTLDTIGSVQSYASMATGLVRNPSRLLAGTALGFLSNSTLNKMKSRSDPQMDCFWEVALPDIPPYTAIEDGILGNLVSSLNNAADSGGSIGKVAGAVGGVVSSVNSAITSVTGSVTSAVKLANEYVEQVDLVFKEYQSREVFRAGHFVKFPDAVCSIDDLNMTFYVGEENEAFTYIENWSNWVMMASSPTVSTGGWSRPINYKKTITVALMDPNSNNIYVIDYLGCWPKSRSNVTLGSSGDRITYDVTFSVDDLKIYGYDLISTKSRIGNAVGNVISSVSDTAGDYVSGVISSVT